MIEWSTLSWHAKCHASEVVEALAKVFERAAQTNSTDEGRAAAVDAFYLLDRAASMLRGEMGAEADQEAREQERIAAQ